MNKAWVITANMGYGHLRAAHPLKDIAYKRIITANSDKLTTESEARTWRRFRIIYEGVSRINKVPIVGGLLWNMYDKLQTISPIYPFRDLSKPNYATIYLDRLINKGFLSGLIDYLKTKEIPLVTTFFAVAIAAAHLNMNEIYCIVTDTDINRIWVPKNPKTNKICYLVPTSTVVTRLQEYGVPKENIYLTGFPLPKENTGKDLRVLKQDLRARLPNLDPNKIYLNKYAPVIAKEINYKKTYKTSRPLTITYSVGGAGAQKEIAKQILRSMKKKLQKGEVKLNLIAGTRPEIRDYFLKEIKKIGLETQLGKSINVIFQLSKTDYFKEFNEILRTTDLLWTKPSELSFYAALGIPIIIAPALGYHEKQNQKWLVQKGIGIPQENPLHCDEWITDWLNKGILAEAAIEGYLEAHKYGTYNVERIVFAKNKKNIKLQI